MALFVRASPGKLMVVGSNATQAANFSLKNDCLGDLCCVALPFCCVVVVNLASLGEIVHTCTNKIQYRSDARYNAYAFYTHSFLALHAFTFRPTRVRVKR